MVESTKSQVLHFDDRQGKVPFCDVETCARELGFHGYFEYISQKKSSDNDGQLQKILPFIAVKTKIFRPKVWR